MRKKIIHSFMITFLISFFLAFGILYAVLYMVFLENQRDEQFQELGIIETLHQADMESLGEYLNELDSRMTIIEKDGDVIYDNQVDSITENHMQREEIQQALQYGQGSSIRYSSTTHTNYLYTAIMNEETQEIYRLAIPFVGITQSAFVLMPSFIVAFFVALCTVWFMSKKMATSIVEPFQKISSTIWITRIGKEKIVFDDSYYPELSEITESIVNMNEEIHDNLEQLEKEKGIRQEFFANASHELKTPLTSIMGYTELLRTHAIQDPAQVDRCLDHVIKESRHMTQLINDILMISKLESEDYQVQFTHVKVKDVLKALIERFHVQIDSMNIDLTLDCEDIVVYANRNHIETIFENLISNAIKYNVYDGTIRIDCHVKDQEMVFSVKDTGIGVSKADQERIFQRFYRVDKQRSKVISGTGLGLSIVKHLVQFYDGRIQLQSEEEKGTTITLFLPIVVKNVPEN